MMNVHYRRVAQGHSCGDPQDGEQRDSDPLHHRVPPLLHPGRGLISEAQGAARTCTVDTNCRDFAPEMLRSAMILMSDGTGT